MTETKNNRKLTDNEKNYRGYVIGRTLTLTDGLRALRYDLESCEGIATDEEINKIEETTVLLIELNKRVKSELKYGLREN